MTKEQLTPYLGKRVKVLIEHEKRQKHGILERFDTTLSSWWGERDAIILTQNKKKVAIVLKYIQTIN